MYIFLLTQSGPEHIPGGAWGVLLLSIAAAIVLGAVLGSPPFKALAAIFQALAARIGGQAYVQQQQLETARELKVMEAQLAAAKLNERLSKLVSASDVVDIKNLLPSGTVTILFSDIEDWSRIAAAQGDEPAFAILQEHNRIIYQTLKGYDGLAVKNYGDGFMIAFPSAKKAVLCSLEIQGALDEFNQGREGSLRVRIGINSGEPIQHAEDYIGSAVNIAARIQNEARGGQILVSEVVKKLAGPITGVQYVHRGLFELQGIQEKQRLYEILAVQALGSGSSVNMLRAIDLYSGTHQES